jgi:hypothetical protein
LTRPGRPAPQYGGPTSKTKGGMRAIHRGTKHYRRSLLCRVPATTHDKTIKTLGKVKQQTSPGRQRKYDSDPAAVYHEPVLYRVLVLPLPCAVFCHEPAIYRWHPCAVCRGPAFAVCPYSFL